MSRVIDKSHPERANVQALKFSEGPQDDALVPFVVAVHDKYKERGNRTEISSEGPVRGRSVSPVRPRTMSDESPMAPIIAPISRPTMSVADRQPPKSDVQTEIERSLIETSREVTRLAAQLDEARSALDGKVQEAYERGLADGERLAAENARNEAERYAYGLERLSHVGQALETQARHEALELSILVAKRILQKEVEISPAFLIETIKRTASQLLGRAEMNIRLNPKDLEAVRRLVPDLATSFPAVALVTLKGDESLELGDCLIDTDVEQINLTLNEQLDALKKALTEQIA